MATASFNSYPDNSASGNFKAWGSALSAAIAVVGLTKTTDTGQLVWSSVPATNPTTGFTFYGYEIWQLTDTLAATFPVYIKVEYGAGTSAAYPSIRVSVGTGTNGAGALTGNISTPAVHMTTSSDTTRLHTSFVSSDGGRLQLGLWVDAQTGYGGVFSISRTVSSAGVTNTNGINIVTYNIVGNSTQTQTQQYIPFPGLGIPFPYTPSTTWCCAAPNTGYATLGSNIGVFPIFPWIGFADNPDMGALAAFKNDIGMSGITIPVSLYGASHNYLTVMNGYGLVTLNGNTNGCGLLMRYE